MSAAEFSNALRNKALAQWFNNERSAGGQASKAKQEEYSLENINVLVNPVSIYRQAEQTSEKTQFVITKDTVKDLIVQFHGVTDQQVLSELTDTYFAAFRAKDTGVKVPRRKITVADGMPAIFFPNISFDSITNLVNSIMNIKKGELQKYYEKGHVIGLTTELLQETANRIKQVDTTGQTGKQFLLTQLDTVIAYYKRLDLSSANLKPAQDIQLYATYEKRASNKTGAKYLVELQTKEQNQASAKEVQATLGTIRKLFGQSKLQEDAIIQLIDGIKDKVSDPKFQQDLVEMRSSPSLVQLISDSIASIVQGKKFDVVYKQKNVLIGTKKLPKVDTTELRKQAKKKIQEAESLKKKIKTQSKKLFTPQGELNTTSLQNLLNRRLHDQIKINMGSGYSKNVLNYRSGRLAQSAKVEKITSGKSGMLTAFYTYMKYPYATFSEGGAQQYPRQRDPKVLISKSIRDIAGVAIANRMRAVNI